MPIDVDLDPADPARIVISTDEGIFLSADAGATWRQRAIVTVETHLAWSEDGRIYRVEAGGSVKASDDGGENWRETGNVEGSPTTITVDSGGRLYVALGGAVIKRSDDGGRTFSELASLSVP